jgi:hypothetical protein
MPKFTPAKEFIRHTRLRATAEPVIRKIDSTIKDNVDTATAKIKSAGKDLREK